jgi:hypothetical protein
MSTRTGWPGSEHKAGHDVSLVSMKSREYLRDRRVVRKE